MYVYVCVCVCVCVCVPCKVECVHTMTTMYACISGCSRQFEKYYQEDMAALGIKDADIITRVTEVCARVRIKLGQWRGLGLRL